MEYKLCIYEVCNALFFSNEDMQNKTFVDESISKFLSKSIDPYIEINQQTGIGITVVFLLSWLLMICVTKN
jgi:hypothetical protein